MKSKLAAKAPIPPGSEEFISVLRTPKGDCVYLVNESAILRISPDPAACGIFIADLVQHVTNALHGKIGMGSGPMPREAIFKRIVDVMTKELETNEPQAKRVVDA